MSQPSNAFPSSSLFLAFQRGDPDAVRYFLDLHKVGLGRYCLTILGSNEAVEDIVWEAFTIAYQDRLKLKDEGALPGYWRQTAKHLCLQYLTAKRKRLALETNWAGYQEADNRAADEEAQLEQLDKLFDAIERLPLQRRRILLLRFYLGKSVKAIANILEIKEQTVYNTINDGRKSLTGKKKPQQKLPKKIK